MHAAGPRVVVSSWSRLGMVLEGYIQRPAARTAPVQSEGVCVGLLAMMYTSLTAHQGKWAAMRGHITVLA